MLSGCFTWFHTAIQLPQATIASGEDTCVRFANHVLRFFNPRWRHECAICLAHGLRCTDGADADAADAETIVLAFKRKDALTAARRQ